jgi:aspartyl protease family protein
MNTDDTGRLLYLGLLLMALIGSFLMGNRQSLGKTAQQASIWAFIFLGAIAVVGLWP